MLARARDRFAAAADRVRFVVSDYSEVPIDGCYDAIVSGLFGRIDVALNQGGIFVNAEQVMGPTPEAESRNRATWLRQVRERGLTEDDLAAALERMKHDRMTPLEVQLRWLIEAGFRDVDCVYKSWMFAVYCGSK
jgi:tRNA (cmo5U34)-methyltransferase